MTSDLAHIWGRDKAPCPCPSSVDGQGLHIWSALSLELFTMYWTFKTIVMVFGLVAQLPGLENGAKQLFSCPGKGSECGIDFGWNVWHKWSWKLFFFQSFSPSHWPCKKYSFWTVCTIWTCVSLSCCCDSLYAQAVSEIGGIRVTFWLLIGLSKGGIEISCLNSRYRQVPPWSLCLTVWRLVLANDLGGPFLQKWLTF